MSKERQRARAVREKARAQARAAAAAEATRRAKASARATRRPGREPVYRLRRFPPLPWRLKVGLGLGWLAAVLLILVFVPSWSGRLGLLVVATAALPLIVVIVRDPSRRPR